MKRRAALRAWIGRNRKSLRVLLLAGLLAAGVPVYLAAPTADIAIDAAAVEGSPDGGA